MDELVISGKKYISSKRASELTGYAKDYIGQLARGGKVPATRIGRAWYVDEVAIILHGSTGEEDQLESNDKEIESETESTKIAINKVHTLSEKKIPTISHAFSQSNGGLPSTWEPISYYPDEAVLFPVKLQRVSINNISISNKLENKGISDIQEKNNLRVRILKSKIEKKNLFGTQTPLASHMTVVPEPKIVIVKQSSHKKKNGHSFLSYTLFITGSAVLVFFVLGSGLLVSSHINFAPQSGAYSANAYISYQYAKDTLAEIPGLQVGLDTLKGFIFFIKDSPSTLFFKGADFLKHLINLV